MLTQIKEKLLPNESTRHNWVASRLSEIPAGFKILDAGCGEQQYRKYCEHLNYFGQDFGEFDASGDGRQPDNWQYGKLDYTGDIWQIDENDKSFDAILCTEVFEHIPYPNETMLEFTRLLKSGGYLIITAPYACLPHFEPYFFYSGFSKQWYQKHCDELGYEIVEITENGNAHGSLAIETLRTARSINNIFLRAIYLLASIPKLTLDVIFSHSQKNDGMIYGLFILAKKL